MSPSNLFPQDTGNLVEEDTERMEVTEGMKDIKKIRSNQDD